MAETIAAVCRWVGVGEDLQKALCDGKGDVAEAKSSGKTDAATLKPGFKAMVGENLAHRQAGREA